jgi:hypothetical protein
MKKTRDGGGEVGQLIMQRKYVWLTKGFGYYSKSRWIDLLG